MRLGELTDSMFCCLAHVRYNAHNFLVVYCSNCWNVPPYAMSCASGPNARELRRAHRNQSSCKQQPDDAHANAFKDRNAMAKRLIELRATWWLQRFVSWAMQYGAGNSNGKRTAQHSVREPVCVKHASKGYELQPRQAGCKHIRTVPELTKGSATQHSSLGNGIKYPTGTKPTGSDPLGKP